MKYLLLLFLLPSFTLLLGCNVKSLQPLYTAETLVQDDAIIGTWQIEGTDSDPTIYTISDNGEGGYDWSYEEDGITVSHTVHLVRLGEFLFADSFPNPSEEQIAAVEDYVYDVAPLHEVFLVLQTEPTLVVTLPTYGWVESEAEAGSFATAYSDTDVEIDGWDDTMILTGSTEELQQLFLAWADNSDGWDDGSDAWDVETVLERMQ